MNNRPKIVFLGTGSAFPRSSYNTCMWVEDGDFTMLIDTGGGNGILKQLEKADVDINRIDRMFITHSHADHILGAVWIARAVVKATEDGIRKTRLTLYANSETLSAFLTICRLTLLPRQYETMSRMVDCVEVSNHQTFVVDSTAWEFFNVRSENVAQTGIKIRFGNGARIAFLGDEALTDANVCETVGCDYVVSGAFCRYADAEKFRPYEKHHFTVLDVARVAETVKLANLVIVHCEDADLQSRQEAYKAEAAKVFSGNTIVPVDFSVLLPVPSKK